MRKVLISPGFGAGWSSWDSGELAEYILEYQPIIEFLEAGNKFVRNERPYHKDNFETPWLDYDEPGQSVLKKLCDECQEKFDSMPYLGGAATLKVEYAYGKIRVHDYDGNESLEEWPGGGWM